MTAFVAFVKSYSIWLYLVCGVGILVALKILADARRLARTTLFSLEQERAGEQTYRAIVLIVVFLLAGGAVTTVNAVSSSLPTPEASILRPSTPTLSALIFPTNTSIPSPTPTLIKPTETPFLTATPVTVTPTRLVTVRPTAAPTATAVPSAGISAPVLFAPWNGMVVTGEGHKNTSLTFKWRWDCTLCVLGPNDRFVITIRYNDRSGRPASPIGAGAQQSDCVGGTCSFTLGQILRGYSFDVYQQAKDDTFLWSVQVKRNDQPVSPPSETWSFVWH